MEKREFKVGDKVKIPKTKSKVLTTSLENCSAIQNAKNLNQNYLYINRISILKIMDDNSFCNLIFKSSWLYKAIFETKSSRISFLKRLTKPMISSFSL